MNEPLRTPLSLVAAVLAASSWATAAPKPPASTPSLSCAGGTGSRLTIQVRAGEPGAPAGFTLRWMTLADYQANSSKWNDAQACTAGFSGNAQGGTYSLGANAAVTVDIGDVLYDTPGASSPCENIPLACDTQYVIQAFAHGNDTYQRSGDSAVLTCSTLPCGPGPCTYTFGYWKTHGPSATGNNTNVWPVASLTLGSVTYTDTQLQAILDMSGSGNGLIALAHQLIAAKLNIANGTPAAAVSSAVADADALIGSLVIPPIGTGSLPSSATSALTATLASYNEGTIGPGHCPSN